MNYKQLQRAKEIEIEISKLVSQKKHLDGSDIEFKSLKLVSRSGLFYDFESDCIDLKTIKSLLLTWINERISRLEAEFEKL